MASNIVSVGDRIDNARPALGGMSNAVKKASEQMNKWVVADDPAKDLIATAKALAQKQGNRLFDNVRYMSLYAGRDFLNDFSSVASPTMPRMADNQLRKHVDTTAGKLIQSNSRVTMMTDMGDWALHNKARKIEGALKGEFARMKVYRELQKVAVDGLVTGTGWLKLAINDEYTAIDAHRVFPNEVFVDEAEAAYGNVQQMYQIRYMAKDSLMALFPEKADIIQKASAAIAPKFAWCQYKVGMIEVVEGWSKPVGQRPGRHTIAVPGGAIIDEEWDEEIFPFVCFKPNDAPFGFYGQGWVEPTMPAQIYLEKMLNIMENCAHLGTAPFWVVAEGAEINYRHLDNIVGHVVSTTGPKPEWVTNAPFHQAAPVYCDMLRKVISDYFGNNEIDSGGQIPINRIDSKKALREYQDQGAARITTLLERWSNDVFMDLAERTLVLASRIAKAKGGYPVLVKDTYKKAVQLDWQDLDMKRDAYLLTPAPANMLSNTPAAKTDDIKELLQSGLITQKQAQRAMLGPDDINALLAEASATEDDLDFVIGEIVEKGRVGYIRPSSIQDLQRGMVRVADAYLQYRTLNLPEEKLDLFLRWLEDAQEVLADMSAQHDPAPQVAMPAPGGAPPGAAAPLPATGAPNGGIPSDPTGNPSSGPIPSSVTGSPALGALPPSAG
jgi:hypothetical protein